ncbi:hypothetical protein AURDEDRAFT_117749 [Auricularia subglabra TFB-10046 SS5]|uniref:Uncharacterized protein n=1 Tax=Auricularia subglabra (strain TFB-10046 / SS5) TaxID=717982 RepID=J0D5Y5_AURST|nr:hypothetical protein AURDEDRAFT_117749 [Auricularia subglabra TFB-10046 SS5]
MATASWDGRAPRPPDSGDPFLVAAGGALDIKLVVNARLGGTSVIPFFAVRRAWSSRPRVWQTHGQHEPDRPEINCLSLCLTCSASTISQDRVAPVHLSVLVAAGSNEQVVYSLRFPIQHTLINVPRVGILGQYCSSIGVACAHALSSASEHALSRAPRRRSCATRPGLFGLACRRDLSSSAGSAEVGVLRTFAVAPAAHCKTSTAPVSSRLW